MNKEIIIEDARILKFIVENYVLNMKIEETET